jgi:hypothetical protein
MLLKPQVFKTKKKTYGGVSKSMGYVLFNRGFIDQFISELDKIHDLNL